MILSSVNGFLSRMRNQITPPLGPGYGGTVKMRPNTTTLSLKEQHEVAIGNALLRSLGLDGHFIGHGADGVEPDLIYQIAGRRVGIEIPTAYYDDHQAKVEWQLARGDLQPDPSGITAIMRPGDWVDEPRRLIASRVQRELDDKCSKTYSGVDATWLCVEQHAQLADAAETQQLASRVRVSALHPFERVYLGAYSHAGDGGGFRVYDLLPV